MSDNTPLNEAQLRGDIGSIKRIFTDISADQPDGSTIHQFPNGTIKLDYCQDNKTYEVAVVDGEIYSEGNHERLGASCMRLCFDNESTIEDAEIVRFGEENFESITKVDQKELGYFVADVLLQLKNELPS